MSELPLRKYSLIAKLIPQDVVEGINITIRHDRTRSIITIKRGIVRVEYTASGSLHENEFDSQEFLYRRIYHLLRSTFQAQAVFWTSQPVHIFPTVSHFLDPSDYSPLVDLELTIEKRKITNENISHAFYIAQMADIFPYLKWALRDYYVTLFLSRHDGVMFLWRALASILCFFVGESKKNNAETTSHIKLVSDILCLDSKVFLDVKSLVNHERSLGRHSSNLPNSRKREISEIFGPERYGPRIDETRLSGMNFHRSEYRDQWLKNAVHLTPPTLSDEEWEKVVHFTQTAIRKYISYLGQYSSQDLIFPVFGTDPCE